VTSVVISDLHLGTHGTLLASAEVRARLRSELERADQVVLLGDVVDLRYAPVRQVLEEARPILEEIGSAAGRVVLVPGNHDHQLAAPILDRLRLEGTPLGLEHTAESGFSGLSAAVAEWLGGATIAYPGIWLRPDVYATHGHYLDCHMTVPRPEVVFASVSQRLTGRIPARATPADYEAALAPLYSFAYDLAQAPRSRAITAGHPARAWQALKVSGWRVFDSRSGSVSRRANGLVVATAVAALNRAGLGPFRADLSGAELGRAAVAAMHEVVSRLELEAEYVVFGHTHRAGGSKLINAGSWSVSPNWPALPAQGDPYRAGTCVVVEDAGPPRLVSLLDGLPASELAPTRVLAAS
jgi:predicted phosphodiesterase